jgi:hypothetical protein
MGAWPIRCTVAFLALGSLAAGAAPLPERVFGHGFEGFDALVFVMPFQGAPQVQNGDVEIDSALDAVDLYVIVDRSGSMSAEITAVKNNLSSVVASLRCPPSGSGVPGNCLPDLWAGAGAVGYSGSGADAYRNFVDVQPNPSFAGLATNEPGGCCSEPLVFSVYAAVTGSGGANFALAGVAARASCAASPAANAGYTGFGYPCFRQGALPLVLLATDEPPLSPGDTNKVPDWATVVLPAMRARSARLIGVTGSGFGANTDLDLRRMATDTGAVDADNADAPLVFDGAGANAAAAIQAGVQAARRIPLRIDATAHDDAGDAVDAVAAFVGRLETLQSGTATCAAGQATEDGNGDGFADRYLATRAGTPVCWRLVPRANTTVPATAAMQTFHATVRVVADDNIALGQREVYFLVPPLP